MKSLKTYLVVGGILLTIYIVAQLNRPTIIDWSENLITKEKTPFGTYILFNRIKDIFPGAEVTPYRQPVYNVIAEDSIKQSTYIIIAAGIEFSKPDYEQLVKYVKAGNDVFIASEYFGKIFNDKLQTYTQEDLKLSQKSVPCDFLNPALNPKKYFDIGKGTGTAYFGSFDTLKATVLGENNNHDANFIKYTFGKGSLYLMTNPKYFTNYSLLRPDGAEYASKALSYLKNTKQLIWDEYYTQGDMGDDSPMRVFLKSDMLQWAYYLSIFSLLIYVLFEVKRRQRIIPLIDPLKNSTVDFVNVVGQVYYEKRNNSNIAQKKILYLLEHLREVYNLKTNKLDQEFIGIFAAKLGLDKTFANELISYIHYINNQQNVTDRELIELNKLIEQLYSLTT